MVDDVLVVDSLVGEGMAALCTTHYMEEAERVEAERVEPGGGAMALLLATVGGRSLRRSLARAM